MLQNKLRELRNVLKKVERTQKCVKISWENSECVKNKLRELRNVLKNKLRELRNVLKISWENSEMC